MDRQTNVLGGDDSFLSFFNQDMSNLVSVDNDDRIKRNLLFHSNTGKKAGWNLLASDISLIAIFGITNKLVSQNYALHLLMEIWIIVSAMEKCCHAQNYARCKA